MITLSYSEFAADGGEFDDGSWERGVSERLCERAHVVSHLEFLALKNASTLICSTKLILRWMVKERERIFIGEYESASVAYQNISRSWACVLKRSSSTIRLFVFLYLVYSTRCSLFWFLFTLRFTFSTPHISHWEQAITQTGWDRFMRRQPKWGWWQRCDVMSSWEQTLSLGAYINPSIHFDGG